MDKFPFEKSHVLKENYAEHQNIHIVWPGMCRKALF